LTGHPLEHGQEELLDGAEVVVDERLIHPRPIGHLARGDADHPFGDEELLGGVEQCHPRRVSSFGHQWAP
jgi:hypothetical protein